MEYRIAAILLAILLTAEFLTGGCSAGRPGTLGARVNSLWSAQRKNAAIEQAWRECCLEVSTEPQGE